MMNTVKNICIAIGFFLFLVVVGAVVSHIVSNATIPESPKQESGSSSHKFIIVGEVWAPFEYLEDGKPKGIDVEVLDHIFGKLKIDYEIQFYPWARAEWMAQNGKADAVISVSYKKSREEFLMYTDSQKQFGVDGARGAEFLWNAKYVFFCRKSKKAELEFDSYAQIRADAYRLVTIRGYTYNRQFREARLPSIIVTSQEEGFQMLAEGQVDLFPNELTVGRAALKKLGLSDKITRLDKALFTKPYLMPFCKKSDFPNKEELMLRFYDELNKMRDSGNYRKIYLKYTEPLSKSPIPIP